MPPLFHDFIALKASLFLVVPYVHVLGLVLAHVAVITLSDAPIAGYKPYLFQQVLIIIIIGILYFFCYYVRRLSLDLLL